MKQAFLTHDMLLVTSALGERAVEFAAQLAKGASGADATNSLAIAAVAFTIQLAIEQGDGDPVALRRSEEKLIALLWKS